jgi:hypothetical protein
VFRKRVASQEESSAKAMYQRMISVMRHSALKAGPLATFIMNQQRFTRYSIVACTPSDSSTLDGAERLKPYLLQ